MTDKPIPHIVIVDDDPVNNMICSKIIDLVLANAYIQTFTNPEIGLKYIQGIAAEKDAPRTILFLDINMPEMTGWQFMDQFNQIANKKAVEVYILSSSVNDADRYQAEDNADILGYIVKPLDPERVKKIISG
jgi:CheY-like chemotaxis protein